MVGVAVNVTDTPLQTVVALALIDTEAGNEEPTLIVIAFEVAVAGVAQAALLVSTQLITSLSLSVALLNEALFVPAFKPFTFHWYDGLAPPLLAVAVNTAVLPEQMLLVVVAILTDGVTFGTTVILILFDVALFGTAQADAEVTVHHTESLFDNANVENVELLVPAFVPFTFHWYVGLDPAFVAVAVNVVCVPLHTVVVEVLIVMDGELFGFTVITIGNEVAVAGEAHPDELVSTTRTVSLFNSVLLLKVFVLPLWFTPFTFHW